MEEIDNSCYRQEEQPQAHWRAPAVPLHGGEAVFQAIFGVIPVAGMLVMHLF